MKNVRLERDIANRKEQASFFAQKEAICGMSQEKCGKRLKNLKKVVDARKEDRTIRNFFIPCQEDISGQILKLNSVSIIKNHKPVSKKINIILKKMNACS